MSSEERKNEQPQKKLYHKIKWIQFSGRTTPIILQNNNGPCPLIAICNVLLLKEDNLKLKVDADEVSQEMLLSLVVDKFIEFNSNVKNEVSGYVENQQQNISDAIDLLPRLGTGIDVNIKFHSIDAFEFTREYAIFDLLNIPLYHGWIVDPQDYDTAIALGEKSYNTIMVELVALETPNMKGELNINNTLEDGPVYFVPATSATREDPSPSLSRSVSFEDSPRSVVSNHQKVRKGDMEEETKLFKALKVSEIENSISHDWDSIGEYSSVASSGEGTIDEDCGGGNTPSFQNLQNEEVSSTSGFDEEDHIHHPSLADSEVCFQSNVVDNPSSDVLVNKNYEGCTPCNSVVLKANVDTMIHVSGPISNVENHKIALGVNGVGVDQTTLISDNEPSGDQAGVYYRTDLSGICTSNVDFDSSNSESLNEGEECIRDLGITVDEEKELMYKGELVLAEQADNGTANSSNVRRSEKELTPYQGALIRNFLNSNASQLTLNGISCLQDNLKELEPCVFFRNNHFSTMIKFDGEIYLLVTDQGYINQPYLVWEKLNEVNGNTMYMTGTFEEFKLENHTNDTNDYLAKIESSGDSGSVLIFNWQ